MRRVNVWGDSVCVCVCDGQKNVLCEGKCEGAIRRACNSRCDVCWISLNREAEH